MISFPSSTLIFQIQIIQTEREAPSFGTSLFKIFPASADHISVLTKVIYEILAEASRRGHRIRFCVLYAAHSTTPAAIEEEIGEKEGEFIRRHLPPLNYQIPKAENWR